MSRLKPQKAIVRPRVLDPDIGIVPLETEVESLCRKAEAGAIAICGPAGSGKTTALQHMAQTLDESFKRILFLDEPSGDELLEASQDYLVLYASQRPQKIEHLGVLHLASWSNDDLIEYLLARFRDRCAELVGRVQALPDAGALDGSPCLWAAVLEELATDPALSTAEAALLKHLRSKSTKGDLGKLQLGCLLALTCYGKAYSAAERLGRRAGVDRFISEVRNSEFVKGPAVRSRFLAHPFVKTILAGEALCSLLRNREQLSFLACQLPADLIQRCGRELLNNARAIEFLRGYLTAGPAEFQAMAASLLHATQRGHSLEWCLQSKPKLAGAYLPDIELPRANLDHLSLRNSDLSRANLAGASLVSAQLDQARLPRANLAKADLRAARFQYADLSGADLTEAGIQEASFDDATLVNAKLVKAKGAWISFRGADLRRANFSHADLGGCIIEAARIEGADFSHANLRRASMTGMPLYQARLHRTNLSEACLTRTNLEGVKLERVSFRRAHLENALLTGSRMRHVSFREAKFRGAGLADVDWEGVDLRGAVMKGAIFHMGNTRTGLVNSPIALEGSMTGFYTDEYAEQHFKAPEQIRKANLRGADLRGAKIEGADFYLVDLRDAKLDPDQVKYLRRCRAILEYPT